jgi:streptomycin 6-kinase
VGEEWGLADIAPIVPGGHSGLVFSCVSTHGNAVLKALYDIEDAKRETAILDFWTKTGITAIPALYQAQPENGLLLLEQISPATPLSNFPDDAELERQLATLMRTLHCPLTEDLFPDVSEWFHRWVKGGDFGPLLATGLISRQAIDSVLALGEDLLLSREETVTVHGDLHHDNVLLDERKGLVAVDPYGYASEPALDVAMWSAKRGDESQVGARAHRLGQLLELEPARVDSWTRVIALDSAKMYADIAADEPDRVRHLCAYLHLG